MLAYVFWHWPEAGVGAAAYDADLAGFHAVLAAQAPEGLIASAAYRITRTPWAPDSTHEDWYLVRDFASLGTLNQAAVSGARSAAHDRVARRAAGGTGGLYAAVRGEPSLPLVRVAAWFSKPRGLAYTDFYNSLDAWTKRSGNVLWQRQLTLGPAPEFCLQSAGELRLPADLGAIEVGVSPVVQAIRG